MRNFAATGLVLIAVSVFGCREEEPDPETYPLIPFPEELEAKSGSFHLNENTRIILIPSDVPELHAVVERWVEHARASTPFPLSIVSQETGGDGNAITVRLETTDGGQGGAPVPAGLGLPGIPAESYEMEVRSDGVALQAHGLPGVFYGLETLSQLVPTLRGDEVESLAIPAADIDDRPRFRYRGMHLDVGRHFFPVSFIKRYLDLLAAYKMNVFHWHLTEDQGWRIEIKRYPLLTEVGSCRGETILEKNFDPYVGDGIPYCGFYTQEEVREVVAYARERFITVIPEIEMPGHSVAALAAYPELACTPGPFEVSTRWGVTEDIYCPKEETFEFLEGVLTEIMELFPSPYIHVGGDEAPKDRWEESEIAQEVIQREGLADEEELQSWFIRRIEGFLNDHGRSLVGWDEILEGGLAPNATVMSWRGMAGGMEAAREGHDVIMTPNSNVYLDYYQGDTLQEPLAIGGYSPLEEVYAFDPVPRLLSRAESRHILGAQGNVWTEYMATTDYVEYMVLPRMLALAEVVWSPREARDWPRFSQRLRVHLSRLDEMGFNYRIPDVFGLEGDRLTLADTVVVNLTAPAGQGAIRYTLDDTEPGRGSPVYHGPFSLLLPEEGIQVAARVVLPDGRAGAVRKARFRPARLTPATPLPPRARAQGLAGIVISGEFPSVDSLPPAPTPGSAGTVAMVIPRVTLPRRGPRAAYGLLATGFIRVARSGVYTFFLTSDDGSRLRIDGETVVDHDGYHSASEKRGQAALRRGWHPIEVLYFQGGGGSTLKLELEGPHISRREVPATWFAHAPGAPSRTEIGGQ